MAIPGNNITITASGGFVTFSEAAPGVSTLAGSTSGNFYYCMPSQSSTYKKFVLVLSGVADAGRTINFPTSFTYTPGVFVSSGVTGSFTATTGALTVPSLSTQTGSVIVEGI